MNWRISIQERISPENEPAGTIPERISPDRPYGIEEHMTTRELYKKIEQSLHNEKLVLATTIAGKKQGEKKLYTAKDAPDILGGTAETENGERIFYEKLKGAEELVICGAGHVSLPVIRIGKELGFHVTVVEDRPKYADTARRAGADCVICDDFYHAIDTMKGSYDTYFVIVTRGHRYDMDCLRAALGRKYAYIGMMGSRRRVAMVRQELEQEGYAREALEQVHAPIGLPIDAQTPEEIAVSIAAELIKERHRINGRGGLDEEILRHLSQDDRSCVMSMIISKRGSAPRGEGTRMLVYEDGSVVGTIGGGCMESRLISKSLNMLRFGTQRCHLERIDMTEDEAEEAGMVCGGSIEVYMEIV